MFLSLFCDFILSRTSFIVHVSVLLFFLLGRPSKLSEKQKKALEKHIDVGKITASQEFSLKNVPQGQQGVTRIQHKLIPEIKKCVDDRFESLKSDPIIQAMRIVDQNTWDPTDPNYGKNEISTLAQHYSESLAANNFDLEKSKSEWRLLQKITKRKYSTIRNKLIFWEKVFQNDSAQLTNILLLIEICLAIAVAQGMVERGFSLTRRIITDTRTRLNNKSLDDLLVLRLNVPILKRILGNDYEDKLITKCVSVYTEKRRCSLGKASKTKRSCIRKQGSSPKKPKTTVDANEAQVILTSSSSDEFEGKSPSHHEMSDSDTSSDIESDSDSFMSDIQESVDGSESSSADYSLESEDQVSGDSESSD